MGKKFFFSHFYLFLGGNNFTFNRRFKRFMLAFRKLLDEGNLAFPNFQDSGSDWDIYNIWAQALLLSFGDVQSRQR